MQLFCSGFGDFLTPDLETFLLRIWRLLSSGFGDFFSPDLETFLNGPGTKKNQKTEQSPESRDAKKKQRKWTPAPPRESKGESNRGDVSAPPDSLGVRGFTTWITAAWLLDAERPTTPPQNKLHHGNWQTSSTSGTHTYMMGRSKEKKGLMDFHKRLWKGRNR